MLMVRLVALAMSVAGAVLAASPASAQTYGFASPGARSGAPMAAAVAYVGDQEGATYPHVIYAVSRGRPEGYYWIRFRMDCSRGASAGPQASSHGFVRWEDRVQSVGDANNLLSVTLNGRLLAYRMQCEGYRGDTAVERAQSGGAALRRLRRWQSGSGASDIP